MIIKKRSEGFTLVEILVVVGIIAILSVITIAYINPSLLLKRARDDQRLAEMKQIQSALEAYKGDKGLYPAFGTASSPTYGWAPISGIHLNSAGGSAGAVATVTYLRKVPTGPNTGGQTCSGYIYAIPAGGASYTIFIKLEDVNGTEAQSLKQVPSFPAGTPASGTSKTYTFSSGTCAGNSFNYWVTNP